MGRVRGRDSGLPREAVFYRPNTGTRLPQAQHRQNSNTQREVGTSLTLFEELLAGDSCWDSHLLQRRPLVGHAPVRGRSPGSLWAAQIRVEFFEKGGQCLAGRLGSEAVLGASVT